jgi:hypothetical protein
LKNIDSVNELVADTLESRNKTQKDKFKKLDSDVEKVADVINYSLLQVIESLATHEFKYSKSKRQLYKTVNGFRFEINCNSDSSNLSGVHVGVEFLISVNNNRYKKWYSAVFPYNNNGCLVACDMGKLISNITVCKWELSESSTRRKALVEIIAVIQKYVVPFFDNFKSEDTYRKYLKRTNYRVIFKHYAVMHATWLNDNSLACDLINEIITNNGHTLIELKTAMKYFVQNGYPEYLDAEDVLSIWAKTSIQLRLFE